MRRLAPVMALLWLATVAASPTPTPTHTPTPTPNPTATPIVVTAPPPHGNVNLGAAAGPVGSTVTVTGDHFLPGEAIAIYLDTTDRTLVGPPADSPRNLRHDRPPHARPATRTPPTCRPPQPQALP